MLRLQSTLILIALILTATHVPAQADLLRQVASRRDGRDSSEAAARIASQVLGIPAAELEQISVSVEPFPHTGKTLVKVKAVLSKSGRILTAAADENLAAVDPAALEKRWLSVLHDHPDVKWSTSLRLALETDPTAIRPLVIWLRYPGARYADFEAAEYEAIEWDLATLEEVRAAERRIEEFVIAENGRIVDAFRERLQQIGLPATSWSLTAPVVFTEADRSGALALAALPEVDAVFLENFEGELENNSSNRTHRTHRLHAMGVKGREIALTILENRSVDPMDPDLLVADWYQDPTAPGSPPVGAHVTAVSGCAASRNSVNQGASPDVDLMNANASSFSDADLVCAGDWVVFGPGGAYSPAGCASAPGPLLSSDITSMSFGTSGSDPELQFIDRYFEYQVRYFNDTYLNSAGNRGATDGEITSPGKAWNVITVGNWDDQDDGSWENDLIYFESSFMDPAWQNQATGFWTNLCRKPNLCASGTSVTSLGPGSVGAGSWTGTSMATPHVAGNLACAMSINPTLVGFPEAATALMMATAWNHYNVASLIDDRSGVGAVVGLAAVRAARDKHVRGLIFTPATFAGGAVHLETITLEKGDRARVCIAWSADVSTSYMYPTGHTPHSPSTVSHRPNADLDLQVYRGTLLTAANLVATSASLLDNYEIVEFTPDTTGTYTVVVSAARYDSPGAEAMGLAWSQRTRDISYVELIEHVTDIRESTSGPTLGAGTLPLPPLGLPGMPYVLDVLAPDNPSEAYIAFPSATLGDGLEVSGLTVFPGGAYADGTRIPVTLDAFFDFFVDSLTMGPPIWAGISGFLDPAGLSLVHNLALPPIPGAEGLSFYETALVADSNASGAATIAEAKKVTLWPLPTIKTLGNDDSFVQSLPFGFKFFGTTYTECHVNSNGSITFGAPDPTGMPSAAAMAAGPPRIAFLWTDLDPTLVGPDGAALIRVREIFQLDSRVVIEFIDVTEHATPSTSNTVRVTLSSDHLITIESLDSNPSGSLVVGITKGAGATIPAGIAAGGLDITSHGLFEGAAFDTLFEAFGPGTFDLADGNPFFDTLRFQPLDAACTKYRIELELRHF